MEHKARLVMSFMLFLFCTETSQAQTGRSVLLPESATKQLVRMHYLRGSSIGGYWQPTKKEVATLESNLSKIADLRSEGALVGMQISEPAKDNRQYVAVTVNGRKTIYVNAFCGSASPAWATQLEVIMDGGTCVWRVLYDVDTQTFSHLMTNGRA